MVYLLEIDHSGRGACAKQLGLVCGDGRLQERQDLDSHRGCLLEVRVPVLVLVLLEFVLEPHVLLLVERDRLEVCHWTPWGRWEREVGFEPTAEGLEDRDSTRLSYTRLKGMVAEVRVERTTSGL